MTTPAYQAAVDAKVAQADELIRSGRQQDGWSQGLRRIIEEMSDEAVDMGGWHMGADQYDPPPAVAGRLERAVELAAEAFSECQAAKRLLNRG